MPYRVTKRFTSGTLAGLTITEITSVPFEPGEVIAPWAYGPSGYTVEAVEALP